MMCVIPRLVGIIDRLLPGPLGRKVRDKVDIFLERYPVYIQGKSGCVLPDVSIVIVTVDSLRYDVAKTADTPNLRKIFAKAGIRGWYKVGAHGTYTLPSHISMFHAGIMPCDNREGVPAPYNREKEKLFKAQLAWERPTEAMFPTPAAPNIVRGFEKLGYRTIGVGGVNWFNTRFPTSNFWKGTYFSEFYWEEEFSEKNFSSFENQIRKIRELRLDKEKRPVFFFLNISSTHTPYMGFGKSPEGQGKALEYVDSHLPALIEVLPEQFILLMLSDHGECFGEDGFWGHGFYHPVVMEVPFAYVEIKEDKLSWTEKS